MNCERTKELGQLQLFTAKIVLVFLKTQPVVVVVQVKLTDLISQIVVLIPYEYLFPIALHHGTGKAAQHCIQQVPIPCASRGLEAHSNYGLRLRTWAGVAPEMQ